MSYAIIYERPDGWWSAGDGFDSEKEATKAALDHAWGGTSWRVIPTKDCGSWLCGEAMKDLVQSTC